MKTVNGEPSSEARTVRTAPPNPRDEAFLDELFDRLVQLLDDGQSPDLNLALAGYEHLRTRALELLALARQVTGQPAESHPQIAGFSILRKLGQGGMGAVYLARQERLGRVVAVKILPHDLTTPRMRERFTREAEALARLRHPNIVTIHDVVPDRAVSAYAMEFVDGHSLAELIQHVSDSSRGASESSSGVARNSGQRDSVAARASMDTVRALLNPPAGALPERSYVAFIARLGLSIARALSAVHAAGLLHRDVKPSNILLRRDGTPLLSDFGLVRDADATLTQPGSFAGTPAYASPEQLRGDTDALDARSDICALGATLYHALALRLPFAGRNPSELLRQIERGGPSPLRKLNPRLPVDLETIVSKALEPDPNRRYQSADALADDLERLLTLQPIRARPAGLLTRSIKLVRRNHGIFAGTIAGTLAAATVSTVLLLYLVFVPRWVADHIRAARLALLDPAQSDRIVSTLYLPPERLYDARSLLRVTRFDQALAGYSAAIRLAPFDAASRREMDVVSDVRAGRPPPADDLRLRGLHAYLSGQSTAAIQAWAQLEARRDPLAAPDPLVSAALGVLYLFDDQPARAYPRLRDAVRAFPNVGFLTLHLADAALQCGDLADAERLFHLSQSQPRANVLGGQERVWAGLLAARGRDQEAEAAFRLAKNRNGPLALQFARFLEARGRINEALPLLAELSLAGPHQSRVARLYPLALERWWQGLSQPARLARIHAALDEEPNAAGSLVGSLRDYQTITCRGRVSQRPTYLAWQNLFVLAALFDSFFSPSLQSLSLSELAERMEVENMPFWNRLNRLSCAEKQFVLNSWKMPALRPIAHGLLSLRTACTIAVGLLARSASAQCDSPPCFQGLGSLPGSDLLSNTFSNGALSADGLTVVGQSKTDSGFEAFRWTAATGMVGLGDGAGGAFYSRALAVSPDGTFVTGETDTASSSCGGHEAFRWSLSEGMVLLGDAPGGCFWSVGTGISADGSRICGESFSEAGQYQASYWTASSGWVGLVQAPSAFTSCSKDGTVMAGGYGGHVIYYSPSTGLLDLGDLPGGSVDGYVYGMTADGNTVIGYGSTDLGQQGFYWSLATGMIALEDLPGGATSGVAYGISQDGSLIVGQGTSDFGAEAVLWDANRAIARVTDVLTAHGVSVPPGWTLTYASSIKINAGVVTICGTALNPSGHTEAWIARYSIAPPPPPGECDSPPCFAGLGDLPGGDIYSTTAASARPLSADGGTVVGYSESGPGLQAFRWTAATGMVGLGDGAGGTFYSAASAVSADGSLVVGSTKSGNATCGFEGFIWSQNTGLVLLGDAPGGCFGSNAYDVSANGGVIAGGATASAGFNGAFWTQGVWTIIDGVQAVPAISADGSVLAGKLSIGGNAFRWTAATGVVDIGNITFPPVTNAFVTSMSADGNVIVGGAEADDFSYELGFRWTRETGMVALADLSGGSVNSWAFGICPDASLIVGCGASASGLEAVIWDSNLTIHRAADVLTSHGVQIPPGWYLLQASGVTLNNGVVTLCGDGVNPSGHRDVWIARYSIAPPPCLGDLDHDGDVDLSDLAIALGNYGCTANCIADLDGDGDMDLSDLSIILSRYGAVCP